MQPFEAWRFDVNILIDRLTLGLEMFGPYADWLWMIPAIWIMTIISLWYLMLHRRRQADRAYLAYASRNLSLLRRLAKQRAREVSYPKRYDYR
ncbi:MAG: hypothetical protein AAFO01_18115 [Pseudomonadota bacterium]